MISAAVPTFWSSALEEQSSTSSLPFAVTEVDPVSFTESDVLQFAAFSIPEPQGVFGATEEFPSIDESLFDLVEIPELEDVGVEASSPSEMAPLEDLLLEEIPALEEVFHSQPCFSRVTEWEAPWEEESVASPSITSTNVTTPTIIVNEEPIIEEVVTSSAISPYVDSIGSESPMSCYSQVSEDLLFPAPAEKRRRVSQISLSSYCSSAGDSTWSPTSASDSDVESRRGGRKSRYTPHDRKERKKAQNRTAAERYRQKRKLQEETIGEEEQQLIDGNNELKIEVTKLQAELSCMKRLMREMLQAKGIKIPPKTNEIHLTQSAA